MAWFIFLFIFAANLNCLLSDPYSYSLAETVSNGKPQAVAYSTSRESKCGKNQVYDVCPAPCPPRTCATKDIQFNCITPPQPGDPDCPPPKCRCADGYYSNAEGECVTKEQCPTNETYAKCGTNEIYEPCPVPTCANQTCENIGKIFDCPFIPANYTCNPECCCKPGYYRNKVNQCITEEECKKCTGDYEYFACDNACDNECDKLSKQSHVNCPIINIQCNSMCYCLEGYARDEYGKCIPISQCPPPQCGLHEVPSDCANNGCLSTCAQPDLIARCTPDLSYCQPGCVCADGYLPDDNGVCVPSDQCPPNVCSLPPETGPCRASITKYYYNPSKKDCIAFTYGGCRGNKNNFDTKEECLQKCSSNKY